MQPNKPKKNYLFIASSFLTNRLSLLSTLTHIFSILNFLFYTFNDCKKSFYLSFQILRFIFFFKKSYFSLIFYFQINLCKIIIIQFILETTISMYKEHNQTSDIITIRSIRVIWQFWQSLNLLLKLLSLHEIYNLNKRPYLYYPMLSFFPIKSML